MIDDLLKLHDQLRDFRPGGSGPLHSIRIVESPNRPRYVLPEEVIPGVPWPPGFRDEINAWSLSFLGTWNIVPLGTAYVIAGGSVVMRPEDVVKITNIAC